MHISDEFNKSSDLYMQKIMADTAKIDANKQAELQNLVKTQRAKEEEALRHTKETLVQREQQEAFRLASQPRLDREGPRNIQQEMERLRPIAERNVELQDRQAAEQRKQANLKEVRRFLDKALGGADQGREPPSRSRADIDRRMDSERRERQDRLDNEHSAPKEQRRERAAPGDLKQTFNRASDPRKFMMQGKPLDRGGRTR